MPATPSGRVEMQVVACGVIGREDAVVLVPGPGGWSLPGARIEAGEGVEEALARGVRAAIGAEVIQSVFLCLTEDPGLLVVVFDLILDSTPEELPAPARWWAVDQLETAPLHPAALRSALRVGDPPAWLPPSPARNRGITARVPAGPKHTQIQRCGGAESRPVGRWRRESPARPGTR